MSKPLCAILWEPLTRNGTAETQGCQQEPYPMVRHPAFDAYGPREPRARKHRAQGLDIRLWLGHTRLVKLNLENPRILVALVALPAFVALGACDRRSPTTAPQPVTSGAASTPAGGASAAPNTNASASASAPASASSSARPPDGPAAVPIHVPPAIQALVDASDRAADDRALDAGRHPGELLAFFGIAPGMKVAELGAGGGFTAELLARAVGPKGKVYGQNSPAILKRFAEAPWSERLKKPIMKNVARVDRDFDDPLPPEAKELDAVFMVLFYHDTVWQKVDRAKMNDNIFKALKHGGVFAVVDHSARPGAGITETETFHRIEQKNLTDEITAAGFRLDGEAFFLRNPSDTRDWNDSPRAAGERRGMSDRFVLKFVKP